MIDISFEDTIETPEVIDAVGFYEKVGFERAGKTVPMWIYEGNDH